MYSFIKNKIKNMIKTAILKSIEDADFHQFAKVDSFGVERKTTTYSPYGLYSNPEDGSLCIVLSQNGNEDSLYTLIWNPKDRLKLKKGEVALWNKKKSSGIKLLDDKIRIEGFDAIIDIEPGGKIKVEGKTVDINASGASVAIDALGKIGITGNGVEINGLPPVAPVEIDGLAFITHIHPTPAGASGAPTAPPAP